LKVFISWSGTSSHQVALALRDWLPKVLQVVDPYVSSEDIDKGARWSTDISKELEDSAFGIICVTPENLVAPWVNFEAGALSKSLDKSRVAPFLFGVPRTAVQGPLLQFQSTLIEHDEVRKLVRSMNAACDHGLPEGRLDEVFEVWWPKLEEELTKLSGAEPEMKEPERPSEEVLAEVLDLVRGQQSILAHPDQLLPPEYIEFVLRDSRDFGVPRSHPAYRDLAGRWRDVQECLDRESDEVPEDLAVALRKLERPIGYILEGADRPRPPRRRIKPELE
jgi:hypothetical protein